MLDPLLGLGALAIVMLTVPAAPSLDPGPSAACPADMRLVAGAHREEVQHVCVEPRRAGKDTHCFAYWEGVTAEEGAETEISVCMDQFEAPNQRGARPLVMQSFEMAAAWCAARGKRTCTEQEWELACEGPSRSPLAYGWRVDKAACNSDKAWRRVDERKLAIGGEVARLEAERLWQGAPSGAYAACASSFGVFDMMGNVEEWVASRKRRRWPGALMGGFWAKPWTGCRGTNDAHEPRFAFYETGFRCCADPRAAGASGAP
jgi:formylglycine-generating enzyme